MADYKFSQGAFKRDTAFGLPKGTVRAICTIILLVMTFALGVLEIVVTLKSKSLGLTPEMLKLIHAIFTAFLSLTSLMLGYYIGKGAK